MASGRNGVESDEMDEEVASTSSSIIGNEIERTWETRLELDWAESHEAAQEDVVEVTS